MDSIFIAPLVLLLLVLVGAWYFFRPRNFRTLAEYERMVVFTATGRLKAVKGPGLIHLWPWETVPDDALMDLRDMVVRDKVLHCQTSDNIVVQIEPAVVYKITDPAKTLTEIQNPEAGITTSAHASLRAIVGTMSLTQVITSRQGIAEQMSSNIAMQAERWGMDVINVEIQEIILDQEVVSAMNLRRAQEEESEANRLATVVQADAKRQAALADSEALRTLADAEKYAVIAKAEGDKTAEILRSEGIASLYQVLAKLGDDVDVALKYEQIQALRTIGESTNSKLVIVPENLSQINGLRDVSLLDRAV